MRAAQACIHASLLCLTVVFALGGPQAARATPALLFEVDNGKVLYAEDQDDLWFPASLTKIMTAYVAFSAIKAGKLNLDGKVSCSLVATLQPPSKVGLPVGGELTVDVALQAVIIKSANDVTVMLAEAVAGSETAFVEMMNTAAQKLGMTRTHFANTNGLPDPNQYTTARDLARLARAVVAEYPEYAHYWSAPALRIGNRRLGSHNALLKTFPGADGLKTGFTCDSGYNVIASATREGRKLMAVVLGESSGDERAIRAASLLEHGFQTYGWKELFNSTDLDTLPADTSAKPLTSVRDSVVAWSCGHHPHRTANGRKPSKAAKSKAKRKIDAADELKGTIKPHPAEKAAAAQPSPQKAQ
ncbi:MAG TPA: D-alanyl-D-alanine carboxypeptidase family protein [Hyphomicrobium sp.]|nr:D-alanyl-D-alanine carboxypeptidase family protein [Hyphomicrobium sp.]